MHSLAEPVQFNRERKDGKEKALVLGGRVLTCVASVTIRLIINDANCLCVNSYTECCSINQEHRCHDCWRKPCLKNDVSMKTFAKRFSQNAMHLQQLPTSPKFCSQTATIHRQPSLSDLYKTVSEMAFLPLLGTWTVTVHFHFFICSTPLAWSLHLNQVMSLPRRQTSLCSRSKAKYRLQQH